MSEPDLPLLARGDILRYGAPAIVLALLGIPLFLFVPPHFVDGLGLDAAAVGLALLLARILDLAADPLAGHYCRTPARAQQLLVAGALVLVAGVYLLFLPPADAGLGTLFFGALLAYLGWTLIAVPLFALGAELPRTDRDRTRLALGREGFAIVGTLLAIALPVLLGVGNDVAATLQLLALLVFVLLLPALLLFRPLLHRAEWGAPLPWRQLLARSQVLFADADYRRALAAYFLNALANGVAASLFVLFVTHVLQAPQALGLLLALYLAAGLLALPLWLWLARRIGVGTAWLGSMVWAALAFALVPLLGAGDITLFALICVATGLSVGADNALPSALQARTVARLRTQTQQDDAGLAFGWWGLATKFALAAGAALGLGLADLGGFDAAAVDAQGTLALALAYGVLPVPLKLVASALVRRLERAA